MEGVFSLLITRWVCIYLEVDFFQCITEI
jgi:hypothetical protein